ARGARRQLALSLVDLSFECCEPFSLRAQFQLLSLRRRGAGGELVARARGLGMQSFELVALARGLGIQLVALAGGRRARLLELPCLSLESLTLGLRCTLSLVQLERASPEVLVELADLALLRNDLD